MLPYILVLGFSCFFPLLFINARRREQLQLCKFVVIALTAFSGFRGYVGTDTFSYHLMFQQRSAESILDGVSQVEPFFLLLIKCVAFFTDSGFFFIGFIAVLQGLILFWVVKTSKSPVLVLCMYAALFYRDFQFNILRSGIAIMLLVLASRVSLLSRGSPISFYALGGAAVLSHASAVIGFVPLVLIKNKGGGERFMSAILVLILFVAAYYFVANEANQLKFLNYVETAELDVQRSFGVGFMVVQVAYLLLFCSYAKLDRLWLSLSVFVLWSVLYWASLQYQFLDRILIVITALWVFWVVELKRDEVRVRLRMLALLIILVLGFYNNFRVLDGLGSADMNYEHSVSPFIPYKFIWDD